MMMSEKVEKVKKVIQCCIQADYTMCEKCPYYTVPQCGAVARKEILTVITRLEEQNKELREENEALRDADSRLEAKLKDARELGQNGVPPMPCSVGDTLWVVFKRDGVISVEKTECKAILWDGEDWLVSENVTDGYALDGEGMFLSIGAAVKKAEEMLRNGND